MNPYATSLALLQADRFATRLILPGNSHPMSMNGKKLPVDLINGSSQIREAIENQKSMTLIRQECKERSERVHCCHPAVSSLSIRSRAVTHQNNNQTYN
ncbi:MAG: hypothetical protein R2875_08380 [Desulfobacterales bacterium]